MPKKTLRQPLEGSFVVAPWQRKSKSGWPKSCQGDPASKSPSEEFASGTCPASPPGRALGADSPAVRSSMLHEALAQYAEPSAAEHAPSGLLMERGTASIAFQPSGRLSGEPPVLSARFGCFPAPIAVTSCGIDCTAFSLGC